MEYGVGVRRRRRRRGELVARQLLLDKYSIYLDTPEGEKIGTITNNISGTTLTLVDNDSNRFALSGNIIYSGTVPITIDLTSPRLLTLLEEQPNGVKQYSQILIDVINSEFATTMDFTDPINSGLVVLL